VSDGAEVKCAGRLFQRLAAETGAQNEFDIRISVYLILNYLDKYPDTNMASFPVQ